MEAGNREANALAEERSQLDSLFVAGAFDEAAESILANTAPFHSFFQRLFPRWRAIRRQLATFYASTPPKSSSILLRDTSRLLQYHRRRARLKEIGKSFGSELRASSQGSVDWALVLADLELVGRIVTTVRLPESAEVFLTSEAFDKDKFVASAGELRESHRVMIEALASLQQSSGMKADLQAGVPTTIGTFTDDLVIWTNWLRIAQRAVSERLKVISQLIAVLAPEQDVDIAECRRHSETLRNLRLKRNELRTVHQKLRDFHDENRFPENADWNSKAVIGRRLLELAKSVLPETTLETATKDFSKDALAASTVECRQCYSNMIEAMALFHQQLGVELSLKNGMVTHNGTSLASDLTTWTNWLLNAKGAISEELAVTSEIVAVLCHGQDVKISECREHASILDNLKKKRQELRTAHRTLFNVGEEDQCPEQMDWTEKARLAQWLLEFVDKHGNYPPAPLVSAASNPSIRLRIKDAVNRIAALRTPQLLASWQFIRTIFPLDKEVSDGVVLASNPIEQLIPWFIARSKDVSRIGEWTNFVNVSTDLQELDLTLLRDEVVEQTVPINEVVDAFLVRFYRIWLEPNQRPPWKSSSVDAEKGCSQKRRRRSYNCRSLVFALKERSAIWCD